MKVITPEISWHNRDPIYSIDFQPRTDGGVNRVVTSGTDKNIRIWSLDEDPEGNATVDFLSNLDRHSRAVNVVRFSPDGDILASAGDDSVIMLWKMQEHPSQTPALFEEDEAQNIENWTVQKILRGHLEDIYDLCWSPDSSNLITGSVDNSAIMWDAKKGKPMAFLKESTSFIQGVTWDPQNKFVATLSCDRKLRIYSVATQQLLHTVHKMSLPSTVKDAKPRMFKMFHDDTMKSFFRRLTFSADGEILITPAGLVDLSETREKKCEESAKNEAEIAKKTDNKASDDAKCSDDVIVVKDAKDTKDTKDNNNKETKEKSDVNATFLFSRTKLTKPAAYLPYPPKATVAVRPCPVLFKLREVPRKTLPADKDADNLAPWEKYETLFCLPYRLVFAVATEDAVLIHDSQQTLPICCVSRIHYHQLSDLAWSSDGLTLMVASTDGYCTVITFGEGELGERYEKQMKDLNQNAAEATKSESKSPSPKTPKTRDGKVNLLIPKKVMKSPLVGQTDPGVSSIGGLSPCTQSMTSPAFNPDKDINALGTPVVLKTGEETMDLHLTLDDSGEDMDTNAQPSDPYVTCIRESESKVTKDLRNVITDEIGNKLKKKSGVTKTLDLKKMQLNNETKVIDSVDNSDAEGLNRRSSKTANNLSPGNSLFPTSKQSDTIKSSQSKNEENQPRRIAFTTIMKKS